MDQADRYETRKNSIRKRNGAPDMKKLRAEMENDLEKRVIEKKMPEIEEEEKKIMEKVLKN